LERIPPKIAIGPWRSQSGGVPNTHTICKIIAVYPLLYVVGLSQLLTGYKKGVTASVLLDI
jgi:hypothetical protein